MMAQAQLSVSWEDHIKNISHGLSALQQSNEFVDMTLAADGYFVKVHQLVMAISSPYIKNLIASAPCPHPVIFLNKMSYATLSSILEYIYTGEVLISLENLNDLLVAAKELHIKGLEDMDITRLLSDKTQKGHGKFSIRSETPIVDQVSHNISEQSEDAVEIGQDMDITPSTHIDDIKLNDEEDPLPMTTADQLPTTGKETNMNTLQYTVSNQGSLQMILNRFMYYLKYTNKDRSRQWRCVDYINSTKCPAYVMTRDDVVIQRYFIPDMNTLQYTVSNQGSLQMILNRFMYYLKYTNKDRSRQWRCVDYINSTKCPAYVMTRDDVVIQRISAHSHPFHDRRILKKLQSGAIFTALHEAEKSGQGLKSKNVKIEINNSKTD